MRNPPRRLLAVLVWAGLVATPSAASGGTYTFLTCSPSTSAGSLQPVDTFPEGLAVGNRCGGPAIGPIAFQGPTDEGALFAEDSTNTTADIPNGAEAGELIAAPQGTAISAISYYRTLHAYNQQSLVPGLWTGDGTSLESCQSPPEGTHECNSLNNQVPVSFTGLNAGSLFFGVRCHLVGGSEFCVPAAPGERHAEADLYSARVTLSEGSSPVLASVSGAAWGGGVLSGQAGLVLSASDYSGIASFEVRSTLGVVLANVAEPCDYYQSIPCPNLSGVSVPLDTNSTPDGTQSFVLTARNAAGNTSTATSPSLTVDNHGPAAPTSLAALLAGNEVVLSWSDPPSTPVALASAAVTLCSATCTSAGTVSPSGSARLPAPAPGSYTVQVALTDTAGRTSPAATTPLVIPSPPPGPKPPKILALIDGRGRLHVAGPPPGVSKGVVRVCWRSRRAGRTLGHRCVNLHVRHGRIAVIFHTTARARRGRITVIVAHGHKILVTLTASRRLPST
jgi:hypothetical protein